MIYSLKKIKIHNSLFDSIYKKLLAFTNKGGQRAVRNSNENNMWQLVMYFGITKNMTEKGTYFMSVLKESCLSEI